MLLEDKSIIINSIYSLSEEHNLDGNLNVIISEIILNNLGQNNEGINKVQASTILSMKKLFLKIFPELHSPVFDDILKIVFESDVDNLEEMSKKIHIRSDIFNIIIGVYTENDQKIKDSLIALIQDILPDHFVEIFNAVYDVYKGTGDMYTSLPKILNIEPKIIIQLPIAIIKNDKDFIRKSIKEVIKLIIKSTNLDIKYEELEGFLLDIQLLIQGYDKNIDSLISNSLQGIIPYSAKVLHMASKGDNSFIKEILEGLGLSNQKDIIVEFLSIISNENLSLKEIGFKLGLFEESIHVLETLVEFIITLTEYRSKVKAQEKVLYKEETKTYIKVKNPIDREFVDPIKTKIYHLLMTLAKNGAIDARTKTLRNKYHIHSIANRYAHKFRLKYSRVQDTLDNINSKLSIEEIQDFCRSQADKLIEEGDIKEKEIISSVVVYLGLTKKNYNYLKSF